MVLPEWKLHDNLTRSTVDYRKYLGFRSVVERIDLCLFEVVEDFKRK